MHAYKDALGARRGRERQKVRSVWVLYPGDDTAFFSETGGRTSAVPDRREDLVGVGALPMQPDREPVELRRALRTMLRGSLTLYLFDDLKPERAVHAQLVDCPVLGCGQRVNRACTGMAPGSGVPMSRSRHLRHTVDVLVRAPDQAAAAPSQHPLDRPIRQRPHEKHPARQARVPYAPRAKRRRDHLERLPRAGPRRAGRTTAQRSASGRRRRPAHHLVVIGGAPPRSQVEESRRLEVSGINARHAFEIRPDQGSEPDLMILTKDTLFIIEAKVGATNVVQCKKPEVVRDSYMHGVAGDNEHFTRVFRSSFDEIAVDEKLYELTRFWLLGDLDGRAAGAPVLPRLPSPPRRRAASRGRRQASRRSPSAFRSTSASTMVSASNCSLGSGSTNGAPPTPRRAPMPARWPPTWPRRRPATRP